MTSLLDLLESLNAGHKVHNLLKLHFDFTQFQVSIQLLITISLSGDSIKHETTDRLVKRFII